MQYKQLDQQSCPTIIGIDLSSVKSLQQASTFAWMERGHIFYS